MAAKGNECRELKNYLEDDLEEHLLTWYEKAANRQYFYWNACSLLSVVAGFITSILAALMAKGAFQEYGWWLLIVLPALGSLAATLLNQFRFEEFEDLRELGRIELQDTIDWGYGQLAAARDEPRCSEIYEDLRKKVTDLEMRQHRRSHEILRSPLKKKAPP
jgi:hypothetical protein